MAANPRRGAARTERAAKQVGCASELASWIAPRSLADVKELARLIALAEWAPECYRDVDGNYVVPKIELAILHGASVGIGPIAAVQSIAIINGRPSIWGDGALSVIEHSGLLEDMDEAYEDDSDEGITAVCTMQRRDRPTPVLGRFSAGMADRAGLTQTDGPWQTYLERMLRMRARSWAMRDGFADILRGLHIREEVEDFERSRPSRPSAAQDRFARARWHNPAPRPLRLVAPSSVAPGTPKSDPRIDGGTPTGIREPNPSAARASRPPPNGAVKPVQASDSDRRSEGLVGQTEPRPALQFEINPAWGMQKLFHRYRAALDRVAANGAAPLSELPRFREANAHLEERLRTALPERMQALDATYRPIDREADTGSKLAGGVAQLGLTADQGAQRAIP